MNTKLATLLNSRIEKATATEGGDLIERIQQAARDREERGRPEGRNHVQQFFYEAAQQPEPQEPRTVLQKRPCSHVECIGFSDCKTAATYGGVDV